MRHLLMNDINFFSSLVPRRKKKMKFAVPRIWREPTDHINDCYFCVVNPRKRRAGKNAKKILYPNLPSTSAPVPHSEIFPVPSSPNVKTQEMVPLSQLSSNSEGSEFIIATPSVEPHLIDAEEFNDLIRDLNLPKIKAEILGSRLKQRNLLKDNVKISDQRKRHEMFAGFFRKEGGLCYCNDVKGLFDAIGIPCISSEWRLFIDSSTRSLKAVLLHNGNKFPSLPLAHSVMLKENYESVKMVLQVLKYEQYAWPVIGDFKMVGFLVGMQGGYTKYPCYLCLWDSRADALHYQQHSWPQRSEFQIGQHNVKNKPIVEPDRILMPPLHIKLGLMKQFVKALRQDSEAFQYLKTFFPKLSEAKIKAGIFVGPQIKKIMASEHFLQLLSTHEKQAWLSLKAVIHGFLGNKKAENYEELISNMLDSFKVMGCRMSLKLHMLHAHLDKFKDNLGEYSEEQGERFHQDIMNFEQRYQGQYNENMMGDYIWMLIRESSDDYTRNTKSIHF